MTRRFRLIAILLPLGLLAGCVWPPDSTQLPNPYYNQEYASYLVQHISERSLAGVEQTITLVSPDNSYYSYSDSVRYILVNGDTAYSHPVISMPPVYDSSAPYHVDGSANFVTVVFPSSSITDTNFVSNLTIQITAPPYGDTISRLNDALFGYRANSDFSYTGTFQITDSVLYYSQSLNLNTGAVDFPVTEVQTFKPGTIWASLSFLGFLNNDGYNVPGNHALEVERIVAYPLR
jgi:hypothetical protein